MIAAATLLTYSTDQRPVAARMNTNTTHEHEPHLNSVEGESSLPDTVFHLPSSPPLYARDLEFASMENNTGFKSEPPLTQDADATRPQPKRVSSEETERPPSAQQARDDEDERDNDNDEQEEEADPSDRIVDFDWDDLYYRYQEAVSRCHDEETELMQEWGGLMDVQFSDGKQLC